LVASPLAYIAVLLLAGLIPEWPLRNWIYIGVVCLTVTGIYVPATRRLAPDSCKKLFEQLVRLLRSGLQPRGFPVAGVAEERCHPAPQRTVCRTGAAYYNPPRCFACSIVS
jgi:hypothetical protein